MHQKSPWPRKNWKWFIAPAALLFTMLPLGFGSTPRGIDSFVGAALWVAASLFSIPILKACIKLGENKTLQAFHEKLKKLLFSSSERHFRAVVFLISVLASYILAYLLNDNLPNVIDAIAQYDHARFLLEYRFSVPGHPLREFFPMDNVIHNERWYSQYSLGALLPLALGHLIGLPSIINPLLCGISVLLLYALAKDHYRFEIARVAGALAAFCPLWWYMASDYMSHNTTLPTLLLYLWATERALDRGKISYGLLAGLGLGLAAITRPYTAIGFALPVLAYTFARLLRLPAKHWISMVIAGLICLLFCVWQLYFNQQTTGEAFRFAPNVLFGDQVSIGFGQTITAENFLGYKGYIHGLWNGIGNRSNDMVGLNLYLFNWPIPSLVFVFFAIAVFRMSRFTKLMLACWVSLAILYIPYFYQDWCYGPRFMHEITGFLIILTAYGLYHFRAICRVAGLAVLAKLSASSLLAMLGMLYLSSAILFVVGLPRGIYACGTNMPPLTKELDAAIPDHSLVFSNKSYKQFLVFMPPRDSNRVIYAKDLKDKNQLLMDYYPDRAVFLETKPQHFEKIRDPLKP